MGKFLQSIRLLQTMDQYQESIQLTKLYLWDGFCKTPDKICRQLSMQRLVVHPSTSSKPDPVIRATTDASVIGREVSSNFPNLDIE